MQAIYDFWGGGGGEGAIYKFYMGCGGGGGASNLLPLGRGGEQAIYNFCIGGKQFMTFGGEGTQFVTFGGEANKSNLRLFGGGASNSRPFLLVCVCYDVISCHVIPRELRSSTAEADSKLAQVIKDQFIARVRVATQVHVHARSH